MCVQDAVSRSAKVAPPVNGISSLSLGADSLPQGPGAYATEAGPLLTSSSPAEAPQSAAQKRPPKPPIPPNGSLSNGSSRAETPSGSPRQMGLPKPPWIATNSNSDAYSQLVRPPRATPLLHRPRMSATPSRLSDQGACPQQCIALRPIDCRSPGPA